MTWFPKMRYRRPIVVVFGLVGFLVLVHTMVTVDKTLSVFFGKKEEDDKR